MSATETLLIDLFSEEIPAGMQKGATNDLAKSIADALSAGRAARWFWSGQCKASCWA